MGEAETQSPNSVQSPLSFSAANKNIKGNKSKKGKILWGSKIKDDISTLVLKDEIELYELLRVARKFERKCVQELKKLKGPVRASKLLVLICDILRSLKLVASEVSGPGKVTRAKVYAALGLILSHGISAAIRKKSPTEGIQKSAMEMLAFIRSILDFNSNWVFTTILSSELVSTDTNSNTSGMSPFSQSLLSAVLTDPLLVSNADIVGRKAKAILLLSKLSSSNPQIAGNWKTQEGFCKLVNLSDVETIVNDCKKRLKIKIPNASKLPLFQESVGHDNDNDDDDGSLEYETPAVSWGISTTPGPDLYEGSDVESDSADLVDEVENPSDSEREDTADSYEPSSKRLRIGTNEHESTDDDNAEN